VSYPSVAEVLAPYEGLDRIPLHKLGEQIGMDVAARSYAVKAGVIRTAGRAGRGGGYVVTRDEAARLAVAAAIAAAAAFAVVEVLRLIDGAGLNVEALALALPPT
jgi:hypothetical protein